MFDRTCTTPATCPPTLPCGTHPTGNCCTNCPPPCPCPAQCCPPPCPCTPCAQCRCAPLCRPCPPPRVPDLLTVVPVLPQQLPRRLPTCIPCLPKPGPACWQPMLPCRPPPIPCDPPVPRCCPEPTPCYCPVLPCCNPQCPPAILPKQSPICPRPPRCFDPCLPVKARCDPCDPCCNDVHTLKRRRALVVHNGVKEIRPTGLPERCYRTEDPKVRYGLTEYYKQGSQSGCCYNVCVPLW